VCVRRIAPARVPYGKPTRPKRYAASAVSFSYMRSHSEKSFWQLTGRGTPSLSQVMQNMVMPYAFSLDKPQCLIKPASNSALMDSTWSVCTFPQHSTRAAPGCEELLMLSRARGCCVTGEGAIVGQ